jgi:hypothetical protein
VSAILQGFFGSSVVLLVFLLLSWPTLDPGTGTYLIAVVSFAMLSVLAVGSGALIYVDWDPFEKLI